jgi:hypothetical protein
MLTASPVHPTDILVLRMNRPGVQRNPATIYDPPVSGTTPCECDCSG